jgi:hypothetical protein
MKVASALSYDSSGSVHDVRAFASRAALRANSDTRSYSALRSAASGSRTGHMPTSV